MTDIIVVVSTADCTTEGLGFHSHQGQITCVMSIKTLLSVIYLYIYEYLVIWSP